MSGQAVHRSRIEYRVTAWGGPADAPSIPDTPYDFRVTRRQRSYIVDSAGRRRWQQEYAADKDTEAEVMRLTLAEAIELHRALTSSLADVLDDWNQRYQPSETEETEA